MAPPSVTRTGASWTNAAGGTVHAIEISSGTTRALNVTVFDGATRITIPDLIALPSGSLSVTVNAIGAPGLDVGNFALDADEDKLVQVAGQIIQLN